MQKYLPCLNLLLNLSLLGRRTVQVGRDAFQSSFRTKAALYRKITHTYHGLYIQRERQREHLHMLCFTHSSLSLLFPSHPSSEALHQAQFSIQSFPIKCILSCYTNVVSSRAIHVCLNIWTYLSKIVQYDGVNKDWFKLRRVYLIWRRRKKKSVEVNVATFLKCSMVTKFA